VIDPPSIDVDEDLATETARAAALEALGRVWDPELALDIVSLGLVYDVRIDGDLVDVDMTLTTPGCPVSEQLPGEAAAAVQAALPGTSVTVHLVWDPPWTPERLTPVAIHRLRSPRSR
jgi:metal-sulfur cluster biosynthetic enzyme